jgi:hypothetical protein
MSAYGPKQTFQFRPLMSTFEDKVDMAYCGANVRL